MQEQERATFGKTFGWLALGMDVVLTKERIEAYWHVLKKYPWPTVERTLEHAMARKWFKFPQIGELVELIEGSAEEQAEQAWQQLQQAMAIVGAYTSLQCEDPAVAEAVRMTFGDWPSACLLERDGPDHAVKRREFFSAYRSARQQALSLEDGYLRGLLEAENAARQLAEAMASDRLELGWLPRQGRPDRFPRLELKAKLGQRALPASSEP